VSTDALLHTLRERQSWRACTCRQCRRPGARRIQRRAARRALRMSDEVAEAIEDAGWLADEHNLNVHGECRDMDCERCGAAADAWVAAVVGL
jgi:hypothetical protein